MKYLPSLFALVFGSILLADVPPPSWLPPQARKLPVDEVEKLIKEHPGTGILDVRTAEEVAQRGRLPGAKHLDVFREDFLEQLHRTGLDPAKSCILYCAIGGRAERAAALLARAGFTDIVLPAGGFNAWKMAGKPIEGGRESGQ